MAVVVDGSNAGELESTQEILKILETNAILVLFSPSVALLQIVKDAIQSVIDLPKLELIKGAPLIVSKFVQALQCITLYFPLNLPLPGYLALTIIISPPQSHCKLELERTPGTLY